MYKILIFGMTENPGGVESFLRNYISEISPEKIQFDFLCNSYEKVAYEDELKARGSKMIHFPARSKDYRKYKKELTLFFRKYAKDYAGIWVNVSSLANIDYLKYAKKYGIKKRIIHSHNSKNMDSSLRGMLHHFNRMRIEKYATDFWACSEDAAKWFYKDKLLPKTIIIHNAISTEKMRFHQEKRKEIRDKLGYQNHYVLGNVGRLHFQKNQEFLLKVFALTVRRIPEARLVLVGQGEDLEKLKQLARTLKIQDFVYWAGLQKDICAWLSSFDLFLFPSKFEGTPIAALEAQANGLPILASKEALPDNGIINQNCERLELKEPLEKWVKQISVMRARSERIHPDEIFANFSEKGYELSGEVKKLEQLLYY